MSDNFVLITGCSGGGKSTLLAELASRGHHTVEEPGRRIVKREVEAGGQALPWIDLEAFAHLAVATALADREAASRLHGWVFFDRGWIDAASALQQMTGQRLPVELNQQHPYHRRVFLAPPWPEIYVKDDERRHDFEAGLDEFERLRRELPGLGYEVVLLPKIGVPARADFVLAALAGQVR